MPDLFFVYKLVLLGVLWTVFLIVGLSFVDVSLVDDGLLAGVLQLNASIDNDELKESVVYDMKLFSLDIDWIDDVIDWSSLMEHRSIDYVSTSVR